MKNPLPPYKAVGGCGRPHSLTFSVIRVPFFLEPNYPEDVPFVETNRERLMRKWGGRDGWERQKKSHDLKGRGIDAGIPHFNLDRLASNSMASHRLIQHVAKKFGLSASEAVYDRLNEYYFVDGHALNDRPRLAKVASDVLESLRTSGSLSFAPTHEDATSEESLLTFLNGDGGRKEIKDALNALRDLGVNSIPKFIVGGQTVIDGAAHWTTFVDCFRDIERRGEDACGSPIFADLLGIGEDAVRAGSHQGLCGTEQAA